MLCQDVDECVPEMNNGGCQDICINTIGSYYCECYAGRTLVDGTLCHGKINSFQPHSGPTLSNLTSQSVSLEMYVLLEGKSPPKAE